MLLLGFILYFENQNIGLAIVRNIRYGRRARNPDGTGPEHHAGMQGNFLPNLDVNALAGHIDAPSRQTSYSSAGITPG